MTRIEGHRARTDPLPAEAEQAVGRIESAGAKPAAPASVPGDGAARAKAPSGPAPGPDRLAGDLLARRLARAEAPALPSWYPKDFDLDRAAAAAAAILREQGEPPGSIGPGKARSIVFTDADLTLLQTSVPVYLAHRETGELLADPATGRPFELGLGPDRDQTKELAELKVRHPDVRFDDYRFDFRAFDSAEEILATPEIPQTTGLLRRSDRGGPQNREIVVTARQFDSVPPAIDRYLAARGVDANGVFAVKSPAHAPKLGVDRPDLGTPERKALAMAALLKVYAPAAAEVDTVKVLDDGDWNLAAAAELLPKLFPKTRFEFVDVVHAGGGKYEHRVMARSAPGGKQGDLVDGAGRPVPPDLLAKRAYRSADAPHPAPPRP